MSTNMDNGRSHRQRGSMIGAGIAIGVGFGVALGLSFGNLALGIAIGAAIGVAIGAALESQRSAEDGQMTAVDRPASSRVLLLLLGVGLVLALVVLSVVVLSSIGAI